MIDGSLISLFIFIGIIFIIVLAVFINKVFNKISAKIPKEVTEKPLYKISTQILIVLLILSPLIARSYNDSSIDSYKKLPFDKYEAKSILEKTWKPLKEFNDNTIESSGDNLLLPPKNIKNKDDFMNLFVSTMDEYIALTTYTSLIYEDEDKNLSVKKGVHFYTIYDEGSTVSDAYIKKVNDNEQLIILEEGIHKNSSTQSYSRENIYAKNENGQWILVQLNGLLSSQA
jgi:hypothetical protein